MSGRLASAIDQMELVAQFTQAIKSLRAITIWRS